MFRSRTEPQPDGGRFAPGLWTYAPEPFARSYRIRSLRAIVLLVPSLIWLSLNLVSWPNVPRNPAPLGYSSLAASRPC